MAALFTLPLILLLVLATGKWEVLGRAGGDPLESYKNRSTIGISMTDLNEQESLLFTYLPCIYEKT